MPSPREDVADHLVETCACAGLNESYGIMKTKETDPKGKTYWNITFAKARYLDAVIKVYSEKFILVKWQTAYRTLPAQGQEVFRTETAARDFIVEKFVL